jgi:uncharacterized protein
MLGLRARTEDALLGFVDGEVVNARLPPPHVPVLVELPQLAAVAAAPHPSWPGKAWSGGWHSWLMTTFVFRLQAPRPTFALDMSDEERAIMARHAEHWRPLVESGQMVVFGPVLDDTGSWGLGVVEAYDEEELRAFAAEDPVVTTGTGTMEVGKMLAGYVRPRPAS